jgi:anti-sigma regulatory factor (Ser/Thr protein kinase)
VKFARPDVSVELLVDGHVALRIVDDGDCFDCAMMRPQPSDATSGRGLHIAQVLAETLSVERAGGTCEVTAVF